MRFADSQISFTQAIHINPGIASSFREHAVAADG
jgi:hypothetical protein